jgi:molybdate transport system ATP-binding protein
VTAAPSSSPDGTTRLEAEIQIRLGRLDLDVTLDVAGGGVVALLGPNGAGKTTVLRALAGLIPLDRGHITLSGQVLDDPARNVFVPPEQRPVGVVFQDHLLFPHLSARDNVAFGLRRRGVRRAAARRGADQWLERFGVGDQAPQRPRTLSGGQAQRVALARALVTGPRLLLLDEPLAALDVGTRAEVRRDLRRHLTTFDGIRLLVTHDPVDAYALSDHVVILEQGRIQQSGALAEVTGRPRTRYVADLVGLNLFRGQLLEGVLHLAGGGRLVTASRLSGEGFAAVPPQAVAIHRVHPEGSPRNVWEATVADVDINGDRVRVHLDGQMPLVAEVTPSAVAELDLRPGLAVWASLKATEVTTYPA